MKGQLFTWGRSYYNRHERSKDIALNYLRPKKLEPFSKFKIKSENIVYIIKVSSYSYHNCAIDKEGLLYTWGENNENCLGHQHSSDLDQPMCIEELRLFKAKDCGCGENFTTVILNKNYVEMKNQKIK